MTDKKLSHKEVNYRFTASILRRCASCSMYLDKVPIDCSLVVRPIRPSGVCDRYEPDKAKRHQGD